MRRAEPVESSRKRDEFADIQFDWATHRREAQGSDNFQLTWAESGGTYTGTMINLTTGLPVPVTGPKAGANTSTPARSTSVQITARIPPATVYAHAHASRPAISGSSSMTMATVSSRAANSAGSRASARATRSSKLGCSSTPRCGWSTL